MVVISIAVTESVEEVAAGIPRFITIGSNIPSTIFYTLDGSDPTLMSAMYVEPIKLSDTLKVTLKIYATNGVDSSPILTEEYQTNILENARLPHSATSQQAGTNIPSLYPFGTNTSQPDSVFLSPGEAGITINNPDLAQIPNGFDGSGNPNAFTNEPYTLENYSIVYSKTNSIGQTGDNIGNLPGKVTVETEPPAPEETNQFSNLFDPRAFVIFQDYRDQDPAEPQHINKQFFILQDPNKVKDGSSYYTVGLDAPPVNGSFVKAYSNPRDGTVTYYYFDSWANRWIISKDKYVQNGTFDGNLSTMYADNRLSGSRYVYEWIPFARRSLF